MSTENIVPASDAPAASAYRFAAFFRRSRAGVTATRLGPLAFVFLGACAAPEGERAPILPQDPWSRTERICDWERFAAEHALYDDYLHRNQHLWAPLPEPVDPSARQYPSVACLEAMFADFHVDVHGFMEVSPSIASFEDLLEPMEVKAQAETPISAIAAGLRSFFVWNRGEVSALEPSTLVSEDYVMDLQDVAERYEVERVNQALYAYVAERTSAIVVGSVEEGAERNAGASMNPSTGTMTFFLKDDTTIVMSEGGLSTGLTMVHEARHVNGPGHFRIPCPEGERAVDTDLFGSFGYQTSTMVQLILNTDLVVDSSEMYYSYLLLDLSHIESLIDEDCHTLEEWEMATLGWDEDEEHSILGYPDLTR